MNLPHLLSFHVHFSGTLVLEILSQMSYLVLRNPLLWERDAHVLRVGSQQHGRFVSLVTHKTSEDREVEEAMSWQVNATCQSNEQRKTAKSCWRPTQPCFVHLSDSSAFHAPSHYSEEQCTSFALLCLNILLQSIFSLFPCSVRTSKKTSFL